MGARDKAAFQQRGQCVADQYSSFEAQPKRFINGQLTLGENIADLGGLNVAFDALQTDLKKHPERNKTIDGYTPDQRFFLNFARVWRGSILPQRQEVLLNADPHAPAKFRAIAAPSNMPQFAEAFQCKAGDSMVRSGDTQVKIW